MERGNQEEYLVLGLTRSKKYAKKNSSVCEGQKTIVRYLNTVEKKRVQFVNRRLDEMENKKMMRISSPNENIATNEDKSNNNDGKDLGGLFQINSLSSKGPFVIDLQLEKNLPEKELDPLNFKIVPLNNGMDTNMCEKSKENCHKKRIWGQHRRIKSLTITTLILAVFMAGLILTLVGTMSSVKTGTINQKLET